MSTSTQATIKVEEYKGYQDHARMRSSIKIVQKRLGKGLLTKGQILERFTEQVRLELPGEDDEDPEVLQKITKCFESLKDESGNLEQRKLKGFLDNVLDAFGISDIPDAVDALIRIFNWHAAYPFPIEFSQGPGSPPAVDEAAFTRAVALLNLEPRVTSAPRFSETDIHGVSTVINEPDVGVDFVTLRRRDAQDFRRWLFRSLSGPKQESNNCEPVLVPVPRVILTPRPRIADESYNDRKIWYMTREDERCIDLVDMLADTMPGCQGVFPRPTRDACELALPSLPRHELALSELSIHPDKLDALVKLVSRLDPAYEQQLYGLDAFIDRLASAPSGKSADIGISWEEFDSKLRTKDYTETIANGLDKVFSTFKMTRA